MAFVNVPKLGNDFSEAQKNVALLVGIRCYFFGAMLLSAALLVAGILGANLLPYLFGLFLIGVIGEYCDERTLLLAVEICKKK